MATTLRQPTASTTTTESGSFLLLAGLVGFTFAFRICLTVLWFQDAPESASLLSVALSLTLFIAAALSTIGSTPSVPASCFRTPTLRAIAAFLGLVLLSLLSTPAPFPAPPGYWCPWPADLPPTCFL